VLQLGYRFDYNWAAARDGLQQVRRNFTPMLLGLAVTQINTFNDSIIAWGLAASEKGSQFLPWFGDTLRYPMKQGAAAALYYGERMYEVPLGLVGTAVAVAIFPLLSRHAARGDRRQLGADMTLGLRFVFCLGLPSGIGLMLLAEPIARLLFQTGNFGPEDTLRAARAIAYYSSGVWAYCITQVIVRGFYAVNDCGTPVRVAAWMVALNLTLNLTLVWPLEEAGLALATAIAAGIQSLILLAIFSRSHATLLWRPMMAAVGRTILASSAMALVVCVVFPLMPTGSRTISQLLQVCVPILAGAAIYVGLYWLLGGRELIMLMGGGTRLPVDD
jgi:putative peptidoglycan lipid II flippase